MHRVTTPPLGIIPAAVGATTRDVTAPPAVVTPGNLGMFPDAAVYPSDPQVSEQALGICLDQPDHCSLYTDDLFVKRAELFEVGLAQCNAERSSNFLPCQVLVAVPDFEEPFRGTSSRHLFKTRDLTSAFSSTAWSSYFSKFLSRFTTSEWSEKVRYRRKVHFNKDVAPFTKISVQIARLFR